LVVAKIMTDLRIRELGIIATNRRGFQGKNLPLEVIVPDGFAVELATHIHPVLGLQSDLIERLFQDRQDSDEVIDKALVTTHKVCASGPGDDPRSLSKKAPSMVSEERAVRRRAKTALSWSFVLALLLIIGVSGLASAQLVHTVMAKASAIFTAKPFVSPKAFAPVRSVMTPQVEDREHCQAR
jgi:hypothetical protein